MIFTSHLTRIFNKSIDEKKLNFKNVHAFQNFIVAYSDVSPFAYFIFFKIFYFQF